MTDIRSLLKKRAFVFMSILQEIGLALKAHRQAFLPFFLVFCFLQAGLFYVMPEKNTRFPIVNACLQQQTAEEVKACQERNSGAIIVEKTRIARENSDKIPLVIALSALSLLLSSVLYYFISATYIRRTTKDSLTYSGQEYWHFLTQLLFKYLRPILWNLVPFYGQYMYIRSLLRYELVAPLTILGRNPELKTSWDMTEKKEGTILIFLLSISFLMILSYSIIICLLALVPSIPHFPLEYKELYKAWLCLVKSAGIGVMICVYTLFSFSIYKMLSKKQKTEQAPTEA